MLSGHADQPQPLVLERLPPVQLLDVSDALPSEPALEPEGHHEEWIVRCGKALHGAEVEVVVVIVRDEDEVDRRQGLESEAWRAQSPGPSRGQWARPLTPMRVGEEGDPLQLDQQCRVADPSDGRSRVTWAGHAVPQGHAIVDDTRGLEASRAERAGPGPAQPESGARPTFGPSELRVGIAEAALHMMWRPSRQRLGANGGAGRQQQDRDEREHRGSHASPTAG